MKIKLFGEGPDDVGKHCVKNIPCTIQVLLKSIIEKSLGEEVEFDWKSNHIPRIHAGGFKKKVEKSMKRTVDLGYDAAVFIVDFGGSGGEKRLKNMRKGKEIGHKEGYRVPILLAVAKMELEAWLLADENVRRKNFPQTGSHSFSNIEEIKNPKTLFNSLFGDNLKNETTSKGEIKLKMAQEANVTTILKNCPKSFKPFVAEVREHLVPLFKDNR